MTRTVSAICAGLRPHTRGCWALDAILEAPTDPVPMLVYADFLEERRGPGDEDLAYAFR